MIKNQVDSVKQYLYSISRLELSAANLRNSIEDLECKADSSLKATAYDKIVVTGGESVSKQESYIMAIERNADRITVLRHYLARQEAKLNIFYNAIDSLAREGNMGHLAANVIRHKYIQRIGPDWRIYSLNLFCSEKTFYRAHNLAIRFFFDVIPDFRK